MNQLIKSFYLFVVSLMFFFTTLGINLDVVAKSGKVEMKKPPSNVIMVIPTDDDDDGDDIKVKAKIVTCMDGTGVYNCGSRCPTDAAAEVDNSAGTKSICNLDCGGIQPDLNNDCDCPIAIDKEGGLDCVPPL